MTEQKTSATMERKLTTVLCADVAGYSRLMEEDEVATFESLKKAREIFKSHIEDHGGRLINMAGDAIIAEFSSVVNATTCAINVQENLSEVVKSGMLEVPLSFRIGLNLGDVMVDGKDIFGDGVNIAARLEGLASPGGICISGTVYDHVKGKLSFDFNFIGNKQVKNIKEPVSVYTLSTSPIQTTDLNTHKSEINSDEMSADEAFIRRQVKEQAKFYKRCMTFGAIFLFLLVLNLVTSPSYLWSLWPAAGMTIPLVISAFKLYGDRHFSSDWEERKLDKIKNRRHK
ncbi:adenylate/guanylate cyclase domain-containing protein [Sneathiella glossodoripedis]|uniref:adenylate/guanylate cyclase domain-containing protein n=1 Tax=Sneathiella glossodoripedis TaxID=418853 RepID=UPI000470A846|nr:adenylate/guanylate cyclase domain-containing protein [Sneathiella glossodoripedis]